MDCVNCGADVQTSFCPSCGQRAGVKRLTFRDTVIDLWNNLAGFDGIFLRTLKDLSRNPGKVARGYIAGVRVRYIGPIGYFFFMITLLLLWINVLGIDFADLIRAQQEELGTASDRKGLAMMTQWIGDNIKWFLFLSVPFQALAARWLFFRRSGLNLIEHTIPLFYASGHLFWLSMVSAVLRKFTGDLFTTPITLITLVYFGYLYAGMMTYQAKVKAFFKGIGIYVAGQVLFVLFFSVGMILFLLLLAVIDPEAFNSFRPSRP
jgi:hypothetical protein